MRTLVFIGIATLIHTPVVIGAPVTTSNALVAAVRDGAEGTTIEIGPGVFKLDAPLEPKAAMTLKGAGIDKTFIMHVAAWKPSTKTLPDPEMRTQGMDTRAYLVRLQDKAADITISDMTLRGPQLHGAIFGFGNENLHLHHLRIQDTLWSGIRTFKMKAKIHDCEFIDAGGRWKRGGLPGVDGGITGGAIFAIWMADSEISHNRFVRTQMDKADEFYGVKVRQGKRCRVHHNTIGVNFSIEFPFENDEDVEIDHNLFDFDVQKDHGNLISGFGKTPAKGPAVFHNNMVSNPGRGVIWINEPYGNLTIRNNHIITRTTATPRKEGLFGFNRDCNFKTISIRDNVIQCQGLARPLLRNDESYGAEIRNNTLTNVSDTDRYDNPQADQRAGLEEPLKFECGVHGEFIVEGWNARQSTNTGGK